uniref:Uncharacterized protein n=1 Tax=Anopheles atroparvus TaxID=41427 RepID=A0AAG5CWI2_ANOAO
MMYGKIRNLSRKEAATNNKTLRTVVFPDSNTDQSARNRHPHGRVHLSKQLIQCSQFSIISCKNEIYDKRNKDCLFA